MSTYLETHKSRQRQFRERGVKPSGVVVVHTAESPPDTVGPDTGAENVARFIAERSDFGSYHDLADSDSIVRLVPYSMRAYGDGTGSNPHAYHVSAATQAARWPSLPDKWVDGTVRNMAKAAADYSRWLQRTHGVSVPARRITREQSEKKIPGFISHGERDPGRRTDPGPAFPWERFLAYYAQELRAGSKPTPTEKDDDVNIDKLRFHEKIALIKQLTRSAYDDVRTGSSVTRRGQRYWLRMVLRMANRVRVAKKAGK